MHLWAEKHGYPTRPATPFEEHNLAQGLEAEAFANQFLLQSTQHRIEFQKTVIDGDFEVRVDGLVYDADANAYDLYEVKSATSIKKEHEYDVAFQALVCETNTPLRNAYLLYLNRDYIRNGPLDIGQLFVVANMNDRVAELRSTVLQGRQLTLEVAVSVSPGDEAGCLDPSSCPYPELCHPDLPAYPIYDLPRLNKGKARDLKRQGIRSIKDIPTDYGLSSRQQKQVEIVNSGIPHIDTDGIKLLLDGLGYPLHFLDYETYATAIPRYDGYGAHGQMVFQYSLHVIDGPDSSQLTHTEFLAPGSGDPAPQLLEHLDRHIGREGSVIVWNKVFEGSRNREMAGRYPKYRPLLEGINTRIFDLMDIFSKGYYIHPEFHGSASIKQVLPVLVPERSYSSLAIQKGDEAMTAWKKLMDGDLPREEVDQTRENLLRYCELDTLAMVEIWKALCRL